MKSFKSLMSIIAICIAAWMSVACENYFLGGVEDNVIEELERLALHPTGRAEVKEINLPDDLDAGPNWGVKAYECREGGYDLYPYAGDSATLTSMNIMGRCSVERIKVWVVSKEDAIACVYFTVREGSTLTPGVFDVNDPNCQY